MLRLSQKAMNNVVIFAMLAMIALFNIDSFLPKSSQVSAIAILSEDDYVLKIEQDDAKLERAGGQWRQVSAPDITLNASPETQLQAWYQASLYPADRPEESDSIEPIVAVIWLAGQTQGRVLAFYPSEDIIWVKFQSQWYTLENASLDVMLPWLTQ